MLAAEQFASPASSEGCPNCGDDHATCVLACVYCDRPAVIESNLGLHWHDDDPTPPAAERRCEECHDEFARSAAKQKRRDDYEGYCDARRDAMRDGGW